MTSHDLFGYKIEFKRLDGIQIRVNDITRYSHLYIIYYKATHIIYAPKKPRFANYLFIDVMLLAIYGFMNYNLAACDRFDRQSREYLGRDG